MNDIATALLARRDAANARAEAIGIKRSIVDGDRILIEGSAEALKQARLAIALDAAATVITETGGQS